MATVAELFESVLGRTPAQAGLDYYTNLFGSTVDINEAQAFFQDPSVQAELARTGFQDPSVQAELARTGYNPNVKFQEMLSTPVGAGTAGTFYGGTGGATDGQSTITSGGGNDTIAEGTSTVVGGGGNDTIADTGLTTGQIQDKAAKAYVLGQASKAYHDAVAADNAAQGTEATRTAIYNAGLTFNAALEANGGTFEGVNFEATRPDLVQNHWNTYGGWEMVQQEQGSTWTTIRDAVEAAAVLAAEHFLPGSSIATSQIVSQGAQDYLSSDLVRAYQLANLAYNLGSKLPSSLGGSATTITDAQLADLVNTPGLTNEQIQGALDSWQNSGGLTTAQSTWANGVINTVSSGNPLDTGLSGQQTFVDVTQGAQAGTRIAQSGNQVTVTSPDGITKVLTAVTGANGVTTYTDPAGQQTNIYGNPVTTTGGGTTTTGGGTTTLTGGGGNDTLTGGQSTFDWSDPSTYPWRDIFGTGATMLGGALSGDAAVQAAQTAAIAQIEAARIAAEASKFKPVGVTTRFGQSQFGYDAAGNLTSAGYTLKPETEWQQNELMAQAAQDLLQYRRAQAATAPMGTAAQTMFGMGGAGLISGAGLLTDAELMRVSPAALQAATAPMGTAAQSMFGLGQGYLQRTPQEQAAQYMTEQQALLAPTRERQMAQMLASEQARGTLGLGVGATSTGLGAANPRLEAMLNAQRMQDLGLAAQATQGGQQYAQFGAGMIGQGARTLQDMYGTQTAAYDPYRTALGVGMDYTKFGAGMLGAGGQLQRDMYGTQTAAYAPYQTALGGVTALEALGQQPMDIGTAIGAKTSTAAAQAGLFQGQGMMAAANTMQPANAYSPWGAMLSGAGQAIGNYQTQQQQQQQNQLMAALATGWGR